jgi:DNA modification methylase
MSKDVESMINTVICGDCLEVMKDFPDGCVDLVLTDPPYGHNNNNGDLISRREAALGRGDYVPERDNRPIANDGIEANSLIQRCFPEWERVLVVGGCCCCCCGGGGPDPQFARWALWMDKAFKGFKHMVVWDKGPMGMGWHYRRSYETILVSQKKGAACKWYDKTKKVENIIRDIPKILPSATQHPTIKPLNLMARFIQWHTAPNDLILDPFCGSGTTCVAAKMLGRRFIGIDISEEYCEIARQRLRAVETGVPVAEQKAGQMALFEG